MSISAYCLVGELAKIYLALKKLGHGFTLSAHVLFSWLNLLTANLQTKKIEAILVFHILALLVFHIENNKNKKSVKFQGDILNFCDFIQVFVFTTNHHLKF